MVNTLFVLSQILKYQFFSEGQESLLMPHPCGLLLANRVDLGFFFFFFFFFFFINCPIFLPIPLRQYSSSKFPSSPPPPDTIVSQASPRAASPRDFTFGRTRCYCQPSHEKGWQEGREGQVKHWAICSVVPFSWSDGIRCSISSWPRRCLFCCFQPLCI